MARTRAGLKKAYPARRQAIPKVRGPLQEASDRGQALVTPADMAARPEKYQLSRDDSGRLGPDSTTRGGKRAEVPEPHVRLHDVPGYKRTVRVVISRFIAARHFYASVEEEDNYIWDSGERTWRKPWDSPYLDGRRYGERFNTADAAEKFVQLCLDDNFKGADIEVKREWLNVGYGKEGD